MTRLRIVPRQTEPLPGWTTVVFGDAIQFPDDVVEIALDDVISRCAVEQVDALIANCVNLVPAQTILNFLDLDRIVASFKVVQGTDFDPCTFDGRAHVYTLSELEGILRKQKLNIVRKCHIGNRFLITAIKA